MEKLAGTVFNSCLLNMYRNGSDSLSWHSDNEPVYGSTPVIGEGKIFMTQHHMHTWHGLITCSHQHIEALCEVWFQSRSWYIAACRFGLFWCTKGLSASEKLRS